MNTSSARRRLAFTLIEILVVIAIIAILATLVVFAVVRIGGTSAESQSRTEIALLSTSLDQFKRDFKQYPPSQLVLRSPMNTYNLSNKLEVESLGWISTFWPNISQTKALQWAGPSGAFTGPVLLEGDQVLVFFLGGPPGLGGFSNDPQDPTNPAGPMSGGTPERKKYFDFDNKRLKVFPRTPPPGYLSSSQFPSYVDGWAWLPYIYFGSGKSLNGYELFGVGSVQVTAFNQPVKPYIQSMGPPVVYYNSTKYQIISAGRDGGDKTALTGTPKGGFGQGGLWPPIQPPYGVDDISNFSDKALGSP